MLNCLALQVGTEWNIEKETKRIHKKIKFLKLNL